MTRPYPGGTPGGRVRPPRKRHRVRTVVLSIVGALVALIAISAGSNSSHNSRSSGSAATQVSPSGTASSPSLTAAESLWYQEAVLTWPRQLAGKSQNWVVTLGNKICSARAAGATQQQVVGTAVGKFGGQAGKLTRTAERDLCPSEVPAAPHVLLVMSGSGIRNSAPFLVSTSQVTVTYTFDCSAMGGSGNFIADLNYGNQGSLNSDSQSIANDLAASGGQTTTVYPQNQGQQYYVAVNSECNWTVKVVAG